MAVEAPAGAPQKLKDDSSQGAEPSLSPVHASLEGPATRLQGAAGCWAPWVSCQAVSMPAASSPGSETLESTPTKPGVHQLTPVSPPVVCTAPQGHQDRGGHRRRWSGWRARRAGGGPACDQQGRCRTLRDRSKTAHSCLRAASGVVAWSLLPLGALIHPAGTGQHGGRGEGDRLQGLTPTQPQAERSLQASGAGGQEALTLALRRQAQPVQ